MVERSGTALQHYELSTLMPVQQALGLTVEHGCHIAHRAWLEDYTAKSSTWRELRAVRMVLESLVPKLKNECIRWFSDNHNVVRITDIGSKKPKLQEEAFAVFSFAAQNLIRIEPQWIPCSENQPADYLSCLKDIDDWKIFSQLDRLWGPIPLIDLPII